MTLEKKSNSIEITYFFLSFRWGIINETSQTLRPGRKHAVTRAPAQAHTHSE